ncbi:unnamed protein product [Rotaria socialis]|uniref:Uncharacterized protein n=1 Tax=Rotaria socialis TaxID=392032 RepID=A0A821WKL9_9BILA|nr:unnamed protein product [Rotaria socialis]
MPDRSFKYVHYRNLCSKSHFVRLLAKLFPLAKNQQKSNPYVRDDTIFIKIMVDVGDMSKAPIHIQQLLIEKEVMLSQQSIETDFDKDHYNGQQIST